MAHQEVTAQIVVSEETPEAQIEAIERHLDAHGIAGSVAATYPADGYESLSVGQTHHDPGIAGRYRKGAETWTALIHTGVNALASQHAPEELRAFLDGLRGLLADQSGSSPTDGLLFLVDDETGIRFDIEFQLPLQAYADLEGLRIETFQADPVQFHRKSGPNGRWRSPH